MLFSSLTEKFLALSLCFFFFFSSFPAFFPFLIGFDGCLYVFLLILCFTFWFLEQVQRQFWKLVLTKKISHGVISSYIQKIGSLERKATDTYAQLLERYSGSAKVLRTYARFLAVSTNATLVDK